VVISRRGARLEPVPGRSRDQPTLFAVGARAIDGLAEDAPELVLSPGAAPVSSAKTLDGSASLVLDTGACDAVNPGGARPSCRERRT
jgi:hypothetical protein